MAAGLLGGFVALWMLDYAILRADWCAGSEASCFRNWTAALSGWAAAIAAAGSVGYLALKDRQTAAYETRESQHAALFAARVLRTNQKGLTKILLGLNLDSNGLAHHLETIERSLLMSDHNTYRVRDLNLRMKHGLCLELARAVRSLIMRGGADSIIIEGTKDLERGLEDLVEMLTRFGKSAID